ncbi:MAG: NACHT domain-containing protein [Bacteroidales bacterium]|nr:NACHT domain-containing protein [Bacteroidales bacterium]
MKIIECLFFNTDITHIRLENYDKGHHIDDIIVYRNSKIEYIQVKWTDDGENSYTLYNLLTAQTPQKSIFRQLAEGYISVKNTNIDFSITLFTTKRESSQKRPSEGLKHGLTEIRTNIFDPLKQATVRYDLLPNYATYRDTIEAIRTECSLDEDSFNDFIKKLEFSFSQEPIDQIQSAIKFKFGRLGIEENLFEKLLDGVVNWSIKGEQITKDLVLRQLGITDRFEDKLSHHFKVVDERFYIPNNDLLNKLKTALTDLNGGYIFIEGLPGIGKSAALTKFKETNPEITLAYYCFIPDAKNDFGELRHKSNYFLKSLCISIENQFPDVDLPNKYSDKFEEKFASYIDKLGTLKKKIIFIIDGLDHVHRDTSLNENSLLNQIKGSLPDGIFFVLSSQYKAVLSSSVATQIDSEPKRHIIVAKFNQHEIKQYLNKKGIDADDFLDQIERVSGGIPLYLHYISELLLKTEKRYFEDVLNNLPYLIDGKINSYHEYLFQKISSDEFAKWVLAVFAYRKENSTPETIYEILKLAGLNKSVTDVSDVINNFSHLLRQTNGRVYSIFHNSFREFILSKTESLKEKFNTALVLFYEQTPYTDEAYRNYFNHLNEIGDYQKIISSTTLEWMKSAWKNFRSLEEIRSNIEIALNACVETLSLSNFIRIAFLKSQFSRLSWNLENSDIDFPTLLLNAGETANSLRSVWDGDFVLTNKEYFCYYLKRFYLKTGNLLPHDVIKQGFSKSLKESNSDNLTTLMQAQALAFGEVKEMFDKIDTIKWVKSDKHQVGYHKENFSEEENAKTNLKIKLKVIDYLFECKKYDELIKLSKAFEADKKLLTKIKIALIKLLLPSDKASAIKVIREIDFAIISDKPYFKLITYCSDYLKNEEILQLFPKRDINQPRLYDKVVDREGMHYAIHKDITNLFDELKPIWIFKSEIVDTLLLRVSNLTRPAKDIYNSVFYLSELWNKSRTLNLTENAKVNIAKQAIKELYVPRKIEYRKTEHGLFDADFDPTFIASSIKNIYNTIFNFYTNLFSKENIEELVSYWFTLEESEDGYRHYTIALEIAKVINESQHKNLKELTHKLIKHSEKIARQEEETATLTSYIGEVAEAYGICGFNDDFKRIYNQLIEIAFGLGYKKDYQASYIISPLELLHKTDPENTLKRLSEVLDVQYRLSDAGNGRMLHICLSELIEFTAERFPELAFILLEKEEKNLWREEAIDIVFEPLIKASTKENLPLFFSIVKTLPRWDKGGTRDNFFLTLSLQLLKRAVQLQDDSFISDLLKVVKQNTVVELEDITELEKFSDVFIEAGKDYNEYSLPTPKKKPEAPPKENRLPQDQKFVIKFSAPNITTLIELFEKDYSEFDNLIQSQYEICLKNRRIQTFRNEYYRSKSTFEKFFKALPKDIQLSSEKNLKCVIRNYIDLKNQVIDFNPNSFLKSAELEQFFDKFITNTNSLFPNDALKNFVEKEFEKDKWIENILQFINEHRDYIFSKVISEENVFYLAENVSILQIDNLIAFVNKWTSGKSNSICSLKIANRLVTLNPLKAKEILLKVAQDETDNLLFPRREDSEKLGFDIIETFIKSDKEFGKRFLLRSYISQKGRYGDDLIAALDKLLKYQEYFDDKKAIEVFYECNLQYNKELAEGLPEKDTDYGFIVQHKEKLALSECIIKYLVSIFNYPVVKVRELTLQSVFDLMIEKPDYLKPLFKFGIESGTDNQIEHCLIVLNSISLTNSSILLPFKKELLAITNKNHFNILESLKELLLRLNHSEKDFLNIDELAVVNKLNTKSPILFSNKILNLKKGKNFVYSTFQVDLLKKLYDNEDDETEIQDDVYSDLVSKDLGDYNVEKEGSVHRRYNINTNFDTIEIQSPYYDETKSSINRIFNSKIKRGCFEKIFIESIKTMFRVYDPSKLLYKIKLKPDYINWLPKDISESDFTDFKDLDDLIELFTNRESDYLTLIEIGSQRPIQEYSEKQFTSYFEIIAYLKRKGFDDSVLDKGKTRLIPYIKEENLNVYEISTAKFTSTSFPIKEIKPLFEISENNYRGEYDLVNANLLSDIFSELGIGEANLLEIMQGKKEYPVEAFRWQNAYTSSGRRRYKPTSDGFTLKIKREVLLNYLSQKNMTLCYNITLRRSATKYRPDNYMDWFDLKKRIEVNL